MQHFLRVGVPSKTKHDRFMMKITTKHDRFKTDSRQI